MTYLDANIFLRAIVKPKTETHRIERDTAIGILQEDGVPRFTCSEVVIREVLYQLTNQKEKNGYELPVAEACERVRLFLGLARFQHQRKRELLAALDIWTELPHLGFSDSYSLTLVRATNMEIATFDPHFDAFADLDRYGNAA